MPKKRQQNLGDIGESELIAKIADWLGKANPRAPAGIGDDCAVLPKRPGQTGTLATTDPVILGRHFKTKTPPSAVATKLLNRNISDIAAMGGVPHSALVSVAAPTTLEISWLRAFYRSLGARALKRGINIVGGDCTQTDGFLGIFLTLLGTPPAKPLMRTGARIGDYVYVTGSLGGSILGRHLRFEPRLAEGQWLARQKGVRAAIDVSDGMAKDASALVPANAYCDVDTSALPVSAAARKLAKQSDRHPLDCAINDGEDFELLFVVGCRSAALLEQNWRRKFSTRLTRVGQIRRQRGTTPTLVFNPPLPPEVPTQGYEHYRQA